MFVVFGAFRRFLCFDWGTKIPATPNEGCLFLNPKPHCPLRTPGRESSSRWESTAAVCHVRTTDYRAGLSSLSPSHPNPQPREVSPTLQASLLWCASWESACHARLHVEFYTTPATLAISAARRAQGFSRMRRGEDVARAAKTRRRHDDAGFCSFSLAALMPLVPLSS